MINSIGLACIVKNEESRMPIFLESIQNLFDQIVIVDTGSLDSTLQIIANSTLRLGHTVEHLKWIDDFSFARNFSFSKMHTDLIVWLDADDEMTSEFRNFILSLKTTPLTDVADGHLIKYEYYFQNEEFPRLILDRLSIVKRLSSPIWKFRIYEQLYLKNEAKVKATKIPLRHNVKLEEIDYKISRNINILHKELAELGPNTHDLLYLGLNYYSLKNYLSALKYFEDYLSLDPKNNFVQLRSLQACYMTGDSEKFQILFEKWPCLLPALQGFFYENNLNYVSAIECYKEAQIRVSELNNDMIESHEKIFWSEIIPLQRLIKIYKKLDEQEKVKYYKLKLLAILK